jgi:uncharacterized protein (DUF983 family)
MRKIKKGVHNKYCKYCGEFYETKLRYSEVCEKCKEKNHKQKVEKNLFNNKKGLRVF